jgi:hypothetical protein
MMKAKLLANLKLGLLYLFSIFNWFGWFMVLDATLNNISVIIVASVLLVEETRAPGENHRPVASH